MRVGKKLLSGILGLVLIIVSFGVTANASNVVEIPASEVDSVYNLGVDTNSIEGWANGPHIYSESGIVMDMDSGAILYAKNIDDQHYPASITKVATALLALQIYEMDEVIKFTWDDIGFLEYGDAHIGMKEHEEMKMEDAMYAMLLSSANEVSHAIGAHMDGGYDKFIKLLNETTKKLGCTNSNWINTYGLHDPEHYTSVRDMAIIGAEAFKNEKFREITSTNTHTIPETAMTNQKRYANQNHKMLRQGDSRYYEYCVGGKTGYTDQALTTLITFATKADVNLVAVVMRTHGGGNNAYKDTREMLEYGFNNFTKIDVAEIVKGNKNVSKIVGDACVSLPSGIGITELDTSFTEPKEKGDKIGSICFTYEGQTVGSVDVEITEECYNDIHGIVEIKDAKNDIKKSKSGILVVLKVILIIFGIILAGFLALIGFVIYKRRQIEKRRRMRRLQRRRQMEEARRNNYE